MSRYPVLARRVALTALLGGAFVRPAAAQEVGVRLFRVVGPRDTVMIGFSASEFDALGGAPDVERIARKLVADGQVTAWQYAVGRATDGSTRYVATRRIAVLRNDTLRVEPYAAALPVAAPPTR